MSLIYLAHVFGIAGVSFTAFHLGHVMGTEGMRKRFGRAMLEDHEAFQKEIAKNGEEIRENKEKLDKLLQESGELEKDSMVRWAGAISTVMQLEQENLRLRAELGRKRPAS